MLQRDSGDFCLPARARHLSKPRFKKVHFWKFFEKKSLLEKWIFWAQNTQKVALKTAFLTDFKNFFWNPLFFESRFFENLKSKNHTFDFEIWDFRFFRFLKIFDFFDFFNVLPPVKKMKNFPKNRKFLYFFFRNRTTSAPKLPR